ncbi:MAG: OmpW family outer membrane protein [Arenicellales bacterium]
MQLNKSYGRSISGRAAAVLFVACLAFLVPGKPASAAESSVCASQPIANRFTALGGKYSSISEGVTVDSVSKLQTLFARYEPELREVLSERGMGDVSDALFAAVASGKGISETSIEPGDSFEWMAFRRKGKPVSVAPVCLATKRSYKAYKIDVPIAKGDVTHIYEFVVPEACLNLAYAGQRTLTACRVIAPAEVAAGKDFQVDVSGKSANTQVSVVNDQDQTIKTLSPPFPQQVVLDDPGVYTLRGSGSNEAGDTTSCETRVTVKRVTAWTGRALIGPVYTDEDEIANDQIRSGTAVHSSFETGSGIEGGVGLEYHVNPRVGIEGRLMLASPEVSLTAHTPAQRGSDTENLNVTSLTVGPNYHFYKGSRVDAFAGPFAGYAMVDGVSLSVNSLGVRQNRNFEDRFIWGGQIGADIKLSKNSPWKLHLGAMYTYLILKDKSTGEEVDLKPWTFLGGLARDF